MQATKDKITLKHDRTIDYTNFKSYSDTRAFNKKGTFSDFLTSLQEPKITEDKGTAGGFVGGYVEGSRNNANIKTRSLLTIDIDDYDTENIDVWGNVEKADITAAMYTSHNSRLIKPRYRLLIPLAADINVSEYEAIMRYVIDMLDLPYDPTTLELGRLMYYPTCDDVEQYEFYYQDKGLFDASSISKEELEQFKEISKYTKGDFEKRDPREKENWIGAWCNVYSITDVLENQLSDVYKHYRGNSYTYVQGSTEGGLKVYDENQHAHSHHSTDPISGLNVNSFDLVRLHEFGELDRESLPNTPNNKLPSYNAMIELCMEDEAVMKYFREHIQTNPADDFEKAISNEDWRDALEVNRSGIIKNSRLNIKLILDNDEEVKDLGRINSFSGHREVFNVPPWRKENDTEGLWTDEDEAGLRNFLSFKYGVESPNRINDYLTSIFYKNSYHPVKEYLSNLEWDKSERVDSFFIDYLGAEDTQYTRTVTRKMLVAAVARIFRPGVKFDTSLILVGSQGAGKSYVLSRLGGEWFNESVTSFKGDEALKKLRNSWIIELAELSAMKTSEVEEAKGFISAKEDTYRPSYGRNIVRFPRQCVFFGSTNNYEFLKDTTGNRRFWPVTVKPKARKLNPYVNLEGEEVINQVWAEAVQMYKDGEKLYLDNEKVAKEAEQIQEEHTSDDGLKGIIEIFIEDKTEVHAHQIWHEALGNSKDNLPKRHNVSDINEILRSFDNWYPDRVSIKSEFYKYPRGRGFKRIF